MTIAYTLGVNNNTTVTPAQSLTTSSHTPVANSRFFVAISFERNAHAGALSSTPLTDSLSSTYTQLQLSAGTHTFGASYAQYYGLYYVDIGASPSARTLTYDPYSTTDVGWITLISFSVTCSGTLSIIQSKSFSTASTSNSVTLTLDTAPSSSNSTLFIPGVNIDTPFSAMAAVSGFTALSNPVPNAYATCAVFYMNGNTTAAITESNMGSGGVSSNGGVIVELSESGGGGFVANPKFFQMM